MKRRVSLSLEEDLVEHIDKIAKNNKRSRSDMVSIILSEYKNGKRRK